MIKLISIIFILVSLFSCPIDNSRELYVNIDNHPVNLYNVSLHRLLTILDSSTNVVYLKWIKASYQILIKDIKGDYTSLFDKVNDSVYLIDKFIETNRLNGKKVYLYDIKDVTYVYKKSWNFRDRDITITYYKNYPDYRPHYLFGINIDDFTLKTYLGLYNHNKDLRVGDCGMFYSYHKLNYRKIKHISDYMEINIEFK